jgi:hypothetical protein
MWNFLAGDNLVMWLVDVERPAMTVFADRPAFVALVRLHDVLKPTPLFRTGSWVLVCIIVCGFAWRRRQTPEGAFAFGICGSAAVYVLTFAAVGVASDFRYGYWAVLAGIAGGAVAVSGPGRLRVR